MPYEYKGGQVGHLESDPFYKLAGSGFLREHGSKAPLMEALLRVSRDLPIGTEVRIEKIYHQKRGYEPDAPFTQGQIAEEVTLKLVDHGTWYDPKTGKPRPPKWDVVERRSRKSSLDEWTTKSKNKVEVRDAAGALRARPRSLSAAHRTTRRSNMAGTHVANRAGCSEVWLVTAGMSYEPDSLAEVYEDRLDAERAALKYLRDQYTRGDRDELDDDLMLHKRTREMTTFRLDSYWATVSREPVKGS